MAGVSKKVNTYDDKWSKVSAALPVLPEELFTRPVFTCSTDCVPEFGEHEKLAYLMRSSEPHLIDTRYQKSAMLGALAAEDSGLQEGHACTCRASSARGTLSRICTQCDAYMIMSQARRRSMHAPAGFHWLRVLCQGHALSLVPK